MQDDAVRPLALAFVACPGPGSDDLRPHGLQVRLWVEEHHHGLRHVLVVSLHSPVEGRLQHGRLEQRLPLLALEAAHAEGGEERLAAVQLHGLRVLRLAAALVAQEVRDDQRAPSGDGQPHQRPDLKER